MGLDSRDYYRPSGYGGFSFFPPVLKNLLITNVVIFFIQMILGNILINGIPGDRWMDYFFALNPIGEKYNFQIWQLFTYQFMHANFSHILFNMFVLWMFGMEIENVMGSRKFLLFYLTCGLGAGIAQTLIPPLLSQELAPTIGASGAVYGVMIAFAMFFPDRYIFLYFLIPIKAKYLITIMVIFEFMSIGSPSVIARIAHAGGALTGFLFIILDKQNQFSGRRILSSFKKPKDTFSAGGFGRKFRNAIKKEDIQDAEFYDINENTKNKDMVSQEEIDRILDKISQSGYQNLTDREKKILFEASRKK